MVKMSHALAVGLLGGIAAAAPFIGGIARADTLELYDGRHLHGQVTTTDTGYHIQMKYAQLDVDRSAVKQWVKEESPKNSQPSSTASPELTTPGKPGENTTPSSHPTPATNTSAAALLTQGRDALQARDYAAARDAFSDALVLDRDNPDAQLGLGLAYLYLKDFKRARAPMEAACASPSANRVALLNMAALQLNLNNPMRGARFVMNYLQAHPLPLDEPMLNALGATLMNAESQSRQQTLFQQAQETYEQYTAKLEAARPGLKRWGTQWLPADEADQKLAVWKTRQKEIARLSMQVTALASRAAVQQKELSKQQSLRSRGWNNTASETQRQLSQTRRDLQQAQASLKAAQPTSEQRPPMPTEVPLVTLSSTTPPNVGEASIQVASAPGDTASDFHPADTAPASPDDPGLPNEHQAAPPRPAAPLKPIKITQYAAAFPIGTDLLVTSSAAVDGATHIQLQSLDGTAVDATLVRSSGGLALLRAKGRKFKPLVLGGLFTGGPIQCPALTSVNIFEPIAKLVPGTADPAADGWTIHLQTHPRLAGAPILANGKVIGVELAQRDSDAAGIPAATLDQLRTLLADDLPNRLGSSPDPAASVVQVIATHEKMQ